MKSSKSSKNARILLDGANLSIESLVRVARNTDVPVKLSDAAKSKMEKSRAWVENVQKSGKPVVYGINTGFGSKAIVSITREKLRELQRNLIMSHAAGTGKPLPVEAVRAVMLLRANTLAKGYSGIRVKVVETLLEMLQKDVLPWIPEQGSLGASGDLAPLSHLALVLSCDENNDTAEYSGRAYTYNKHNGTWQITNGLEAMKKAGIQRIALEAKEGLALNNGTQMSTALLALAYQDATQLVKMADIAMAMSLEAVQGMSSAFRKEIHELRPHSGQVDTAKNIRRLTEGSGLLDRDYDKVQDAYSLRCHPQVMSGIRDTLNFIRGVIEVEMNSTNDNPIIIPESDAANKAISGGNFHAQPIAFAADFLSIILCEIGNISERRIFRMSDKNLNGGLPSFLITNPGLENGLMIAQYTAAALVSENKALAHPASIDSIPSCENQEDHVSMAPIAARKARNILENVQNIVAIELLYAAQALDLRINLEAQKIDTSPDKLFGKGTVAAHRAIRKKIPFLEFDRPIYLDIEKALMVIKNGELLTRVEEAVGKLD